MNKYDDRLYFELPEDYYALANEEEDGSQSFVITAGKTTNDKGEDQYKFNAGISKADPDTDADSGSSPAFRIKGRFPAYAEYMHTELQILTRKMFLFEVMIRFSQNDAGYVIHSRRKREIMRYIEDPEILSISVGLLSKNQKKRLLDYALAENLTEKTAI